MLNALRHLLFGQNDTVVATGWILMVITVVWSIIIRAKKMDRCHFGWGVLILPLLAALAATVVGIGFNYIGEVQLLPLAAAALILAVMAQQLMARLLPKVLLVQATFALLAIMLAAKLGLNAITMLIYPPRPVWAWLADIMSYVVVVALLLTVVVIIIALATIIVRAIMRVAKAVSP